MMMNLFKRKQRAEIIRDADGGIHVQSIPDEYLGMFNGGVIMSNMVNLFTSISEVAFPVIQVARRVSAGNYSLKSIKTDGIVYDVPEINKFLTRPHPLYTFREMIMLLVCFKLVTGKAYLYGDAGFESLSKSRWKYCDSYLVLPSQNVRVVTRPRSKIFSATSIDEIIDHFTFLGTTENIKISPGNIMHMRDISLSFDGSYIEGSSRLLSQKYTICNLVASYEARNAIFVKRGALGALVSAKKDDTGALPLTPSEKKSIRDEYNDTYGISRGKSNLMITDVPLTFVRFAMSIQEMRPFDEHLEDAVQIAGIFGVPPDLIPRKDKSTYENQGGAEKSIYINSVIPEARSIVESLNSFLGLEKDGYYLDVNFDDVPVLQPDKQKEAEAREIISRTCEREFYNGIITLNDWIARMGGERKKDAFYDKYMLDMSDEELVRLNRTKSNGKTN